jgi:alkylation response protein AidB-like acyl-CoA dehydrogenase
MARLAQTPGLTDVQRSILETVREFADKEIIPHAQRLEHARWASSASPSTRSTAGSASPC